MKARLTISLAIIVFVALMSNMTISISHWDDSSNTIGEVKFLTEWVSIGSWKIVFHHNCGYRFVNMTVNGSDAMITITHKCHCYCHDNDFWVGLVIDNDVGPPVKLTGYRIVGAYNSSVYLYGPIHAPGSSPYWGSVLYDDLPFPGNVSSVIVFRSDKAIVWVHIYTNSSTSLISLSPIFEIQSP